MFTSYPLVGICKRGKKIALPDPEREIFLFHPYGSSFKAADHLDDWRVQDFNLFQLLDGGHVDYFVVDPEGLNPEATALKLQRIITKYRSRKKHRRCECSLELIFLADPVEPGELFHQNPVVQEIMMQVRNARFYFVPASLTALDLGSMFHYVPKCVTRDEVLVELRWAANELVSAFEADDQEYAHRLRSWISTLMISQEKPSQDEPRHDLATLCKLARV